MKNVAILIPIHNRLSITQHGLSLIDTELRRYKQTPEPACSFQVVVVDDGSTDGSGDWIREHYPEVTVLTGDGNLWWSGAMNVAARHAIGTMKADYLLLWNDDVTPAAGYFGEIGKCILTENLNRAIVGSKIMVYQQPETIWSAGGAFNPLTGEMKMLERAKDQEDYMECDWIAGMGTLIPAFVVQELGLWWDDKRFPQYYGDSDFILRARKKGVKVVTNLRMTIYNKTEHTGVKQKNSLKDLLNGLKSVRSLYNVHKDYLFYTRHAYLPFALYGIFKKYFFYLGGYVKHALLKF